MEDDRKQTGKYLVTVDGLEGFSGKITFHAESIQIEAHCKEKIGPHGPYMHRLSNQKVIFNLTDESTVTIEPELGNA